MEVILKKDFITLGYEGDICKVKDGYARNYLIPRNIAVIKNAGNLKTLAQMQKSLEKKRAKRKMEAEILKGKIVDISVMIPVKVAENGKLYGSVSPQNIVDALKEKEIDINKKDVHMDKHIKELGEYEIEIKLYHSVNANIKINVVNIDTLENEQYDEGCRPHVDGISYNFCLCTEEMRLKIEELLDVNCFDIYGLCEVTGPGVALECIHHNGMHVYEDYFYPEVLNPADNSHCADGEIGELVFTTLAKEGMPLLRYRTKDLTSIDHSTCECGRTLPRISKFKGRTDDMKVIRGVNVFPTQVETALLSVGGGVAPHYLMIVDRENNLDVLTVMVEVDEKYFSDEIRKLDELKNKVAAVLKQALGVAVRVKLVEPKTIERSEGKAKRVIDNRDL